MAVDAYPDSSFLFSVVTKDSHTPDGSGYMVRAAVPLIFTPLHRIELRNAFDRRQRRLAQAAGLKVKP